MTTRVLQANGLVGERVERLFAGASPITHVIYIIKENRTYDQVFGDIAAAGDGTPADGDASLALFGAARPLGGRAGRRRTSRRTTARSRSASACSIASSSTRKRARTATTGRRPRFRRDYVDKAFRWATRAGAAATTTKDSTAQPDLDERELPSGLQLPATRRGQLAAFMRRFVPYLNGWRDAAEPDSLYLWDAAARAGLSLPHATASSSARSRPTTWTAFNRAKPKTYPGCLAHRRRPCPRKQALEAHHNPQLPAFDLWTPDAMTAASYDAAAGRARGVDPLIST